MSTYSTCVTCTCSDLNTFSGIYIYILSRVPKLLSDWQNLELSFKFLQELLRFYRPESQLTTGNPTCKGNMRNDAPTNLEVATSSNSEENVHLAGRLQEAGSYLNGFACFGEELDSFLFGKCLSRLLVLDQICNESTGMQLDL